MKINIIIVVALVSIMALITTLSLCLKRHRNQISIQQINYDSIVKQKEGEILFLSKRYDSIANKMKIDSIVYVEKMTINNREINRLKHYAKNINLTTASGAELDSITGILYPN